MKRLAFAALAAAALVAFPAQSQAQNYLGPVVAFHEDFDFGVGAYFSSPLPALHENVGLLFDAEYFFPGENFSYMTVAGGLSMRFPIENQSIMPFAFGQLAFARVSVDSPISDDDFSNNDIGLHLGGGISFGSTEGGLRPSVGARIELGGGEGFAIFGALGFPLGGS